MTFESGMSGLQLRSLVKSNGELELSLVAIPTPKPGADEVVVRVEAAPINPTDIFLLLGAADLATLEASEAGGRAVVKAKIPAPVMKGMTGRLDQSLPVGSEGAGVVVEAGNSEAARSLLGKKVAALGGAMYSQYRCLKAADCLVLPETATAADGASSFINPLTALGMVETMRREGHKALVHTAAASNLGQMLNKICIKDGIDLVNIVRDAKQEEILRGLGARHVYNSASPDFAEALTGALIATGATLAFDAIGGGPLANQILTAMEAAITHGAKTYNRYGSNVHKQVYIYGGLDTRPIEIRQGFRRRLGRRRLAGVPLSGEARPRDHGEASSKGRRRTHHDICEPLRARGVAGRSARCRDDPRLRQAGHRREISHQSQQDELTFQLFWII